MLRVHGHDVELEEGEAGACDGVAEVDHRVHTQEGNRCQQKTLEDLDHRQLQPGILKAEAALLCDEEEHQQVEGQEDHTHHAVEQHKRVHGGHIEEAVGHKLGQKLEPLGLHIVGVSDQPVIEQGRGQQEDNVQNDILENAFPVPYGGHGLGLRPNDGGEERQVEQGQGQGHEGHQGCGKAQEAAGCPSVPDLLGRINGSLTTQEGDVKEVDAIADGGLVIIGVGVGAVKAVGRPDGLHGQRGAGSGSHGLVAAQGSSGSVAVHEVGAGGHVGRPAGAGRKLEAGGVLTGILHAPKQAGELVIIALDGADVHRSGKKGKQGIFGGDPIVGQVVDVPGIVVIASEHQGTRKNNP